MTNHDVTRDDGLADFSIRSISLLGEARRVYVSGDGPGVIVMPEMPGISPHVARFARWVRDSGIDGLPAVPVRPRRRPRRRRERGTGVSSSVRRAGVPRTRGGESSPITRWLLALARLAHRECGGPGVGAIGMCFTGNFALTMMLESAVVAPVACQPALPVDEPAALEISDAELTAVKERLDRDGLTVLAYRFAGDEICTRARFDAYERALGDSFVAASSPTPPRILTHRRSSPLTSPTPTASSPSTSSIARAKRPPPHATRSSTSLSTGFTAWPPRHSTDAHPNRPLAR